MKLIEDGSCYIVNDINPSKRYPGYIPSNQGQFKYNAYSLREVMDFNKPDICAFACPLLLCTWLSFQISGTIKRVHYCKIIDKTRKVREENLICPDNDLTIEAT